VRMLLVRFMQLVETDHNVIAPVCAGSLRVVWSKKGVEVIARTVGGGKCAYCRVTLLSKTGIFTIKHNYTAKFL
jgi:hypothetical protein